MVSIRSNTLLSRLKSLLALKRHIHSFAEAEAQERSITEISRKRKRAQQPLPDPLSNPEFGRDYADILQWKKLDCRALGLNLLKIPESSWIILKILRNKGFAAYLVGGCVRDLLLNRTPKDFDIITTAALDQVHKQFHRSQIVGRRFPICIVRIKNCVIEVSSFKTVAQDTVDKEKLLASHMRRRCNKSAFVLWRDTMRRDFTINSLFLNPFANEVYDFANGLADLRSLKLRTLMPAHLSFTEDSARILRAVRIAARLGLSLTKEIESATRELSESVMSIHKSRIMMELNYMLSYGAAEPSLSLLQRLGLLQYLLPFHAAYLTCQANRSDQKSMMLMKLLYNLDLLVSCDRPSDCSLWVGLFVFHLALVEKPQHRLVVMALASVLYYGNWEKAVQFARQQAKACICFEPEILDDGDFMSDEILAERVTQLEFLIKASIDVLTNTDSLHERMAIFPGFSCFGLVFVPRNTRNNVVSFFDVAQHYFKFSTNVRTDFKINYGLLQKRNKEESKFVIGKIIMETMGCETNHKVGRMHAHDPKQMLNIIEENIDAQPDIEESCTLANPDMKQTMSSSDSELQQKLIALEQETNKNQATNLHGKSNNIAQREKGLVEKKKCTKCAKGNDRKITEENGNIRQDYIVENQKELAVCHQSPRVKVIMSNNDGLKSETGEPQQFQKNQKHMVVNIQEDMLREQNGESKSQVIKEKCRGSFLSDLFE